MAQKFNPEHVMLSDTLGKEIANPDLTQEFLAQLAQTSVLTRLGKREDMNAAMVRKSIGVGELSDAYFVGEGEKIGTAGFSGKTYVLESKKIAVILPVTNEFLQYTWRDYFNEITPVIVDKFNKKIDGAVFLGLYGNPFGTNVLTAAAKSKNVVVGDITTENVYDLEDIPTYETNAFVGHKTVARGLRGLADGVSKTAIYDRAGTLDDIPYVNLDLGLQADGVTPVEYPAGTLIAGDFNGLRYGIPNGTDLRLMVADQATLSKIQNAGPDTGDVHLFEQDMKALRAIFEIAVAIPVENAFAAIAPEELPGV